MEPPSNAASLLRDPLASGDCMAELMYTSSGLAAAPLTWWTELAATLVIRVPIILPACVSIRDRGVDLKVKQSMCVLLTAKPAR